MDGYLSGRGPWGGNKVHKVILDNINRANNQQSWSNIIS